MFRQAYEFGTKVLSSSFHDIEAFDGISMLFAKHYELDWRRDLFGIFGRYNDLRELRVCKVCSRHAR